MAAGQLTANKNDHADLAILGGEPLFVEPLRVGRPNVGDREAFLQRVGRALDSRFLTNDGPYVREFEERIADFLGVKHAIAVCNATIGLEIAIKSLGLSGEVIVPSFTFLATAQAVKWVGLTPVFADVDLSRHTLDPVSVEKAITEKTTGIIGVHLWGRGCDTDGLSEVAARHRLGLMYDAAHAFGCSHQGEMIANFGQFEVFSFHATKFLNSLEGGAIVTNDPELAARARRMRNFGMANPDQVSDPGTNAKMNEISAAMGLTSLESFDRFVDINRSNHTAYSALLAEAGIQVAPYDADERSNFQYVASVIPDGGLSRDELQRVLEAENVLVRRYFHPGCHRMEPFADSPRVDLPATEELSERVLCFPTGTAVDSATIGAIANVVGLAMKNTERIRGVI